MTYPAGKFTQPFYENVSLGYMACQLGFLTIEAPTTETAPKYSAA